MAKAFLVMWLRSYKEMEWMALNHKLESSAVNKGRSIGSCKPKKAVEELQIFSTLY